MRFFTRYLYAILFVTLGLPTLLVAQSTSTPNKAPRSTVSGRVTIKEKGVAGVVVALQRGEGGIPFEPLQRATTDQDGNFRITNVAPGNYEVIPSAPAYVMAERKDIRSKSVLVGEDDNLEGINFSMVRGGVITGRVTDADGRPMIQQQVTIYRDNPGAQPQPGRSQRTSFPYKTVQTDDRGIYRAYGLQVGRYRAASGRGEDPEYTPNTGRSMFSQVFHPNVTQLDKATVIEVSEGSEANDVDIALGRPLQTYSVSGRVIESERQLAISNLRFGLQRWTGQRADFVNTNAVSNAQGDFIVEGLLPGKYGIYLFPNQNNNEMRAEASTFEIVDQDLTGVILKLGKGATVTGVLAVDTENKAVLAKLPSLQLRSYISSGGGGGIVSSATSPIGPDGSFRLAGLASGNLVFSLGSSNSPIEPKGFRIVRLERDGAVVNGAFDIKDGEQVTGVRIVLLYATASLRGVVTSPNGPLAPGVSISVRLSKPGQTNGMHPPLVDERGHFLIQGIPAGTYELVTVVNPGPNQRAPAKIAKQVVNIQEGTTTDVTVTVEMPEPANP